MNLSLSPRLLACAGFVPQGSRVADIGCDHGYLGLHLLQSGAATHVIAADVRPLPLESAIRNAKKYGFQDKMQFCLSDGVQNIPHDFDVLICAGMGADTMISILSAAPWLQSPAYRLILQCQSKSQDLRRFLSENGWRIAEETVLQDGRFLYTVMEVTYDPEFPRLSVGEWYFPSAMLENPSRETAEYYRRLVRNLRTAVSAQGEQADPILRAALQELEQLSQRTDLSFLKEESS